MSQASLSPILCAQNISLGYADHSGQLRPVLADFSLGVAAGEVVA